MDNKERTKQYDICCERGHMPSGHQQPTNPPYDICRYCGTAYHVEVTPRLLERNVPAGRLPAHARNTAIKVVK